MGFGGGEGVFFPGLWRAWHCRSAPSGDGMPSTRAANQPTPFRWRAVPPHRHPLPSKLFFASQNGSASSSRNCDRPWDLVGCAVSSCLYCRERLSFFV
ncbi:hypothetical protein [Pandoravirus japonicus]|uniref:Uncharacterized protein n=1 Tax=Pandoravirus japonicus TaxID=2823154 RepID=A0A811BS46_9VIRU|nr:hypothetical protein [Pandoravirus japonicus]